MAIDPEDYLEVVRQVTELRVKFPDTKILTDFDILGKTATGDCQMDPDPTHHLLLLRPP